MPDQTGIGVGNTLPFHSQKWASICHHRPNSFFFSSSSAPSDIIIIVCWLIIHLLDRLPPHLCPQQGCSPGDRLVVRMGGLVGAVHAPAVVHQSKAKHAWMEMELSSCVTPSMASSLLGYIKLAIDTCCFSIFLLTTTASTYVSAQEKAEQTINRSSSPPPTGAGASRGGKQEANKQGCVKTTKEECHMKHLVCAKKCTLAAHNKCATKCSRACPIICTNLQFS
jgi:hypothetical protein